MICSHYFSCFFAIFSLFYYCLEYLYHFYVIFLSFVSKWFHICFAPFYSIYMASFIYSKKSIFKVIILKRFKFFIFNTSILIITSLIFRGIDLYCTAGVSRKIGTEALGIYQLVMSVYLFGITLATSGINLAVTRIISEELALDNSGGIKNVMKKCLYITLITSLSTSTIFWINTDFIISNCLHNKVSPAVIHLVCLALPLIAMSSAISGYFAGVRRIYKNAIGQFIEHVAKVLVSAFLISLFLPKGLNYACFSLILGDLISEIISFVYIYIIYLLDKKKYNNIPELAKKNNYTYRTLRISIPIAITSYIRSGLTTLKQLIIPSSLEKSGINCAESLSKYGIINGMALPIIMFPDILVKSFASLLIPEFARYYTKKDFKRTKQMTTILLLLIGIASLSLTILLFVFSDCLGNLIYKDATSGYYIKILAPLATFIYVDTVVDSILRGLDAQVGVMLINILDLAISVSFIYFCVPKLGLLGYIISIYMSVILNFTISLFQLIKIVYFKPKTS